MGVYIPPMNRVQKLTISLLVILKAFNVVKVINKKQDRCTVFHGLANIDRTKAR